MKHIIFCLTIFTALVIGGCAQKQLILEAQVVSMTKSDAGSAEALSIGEEIEERWCTSEGPVFGPADGEIGMADQVIYKAQRGGERADFITQVRVFRDNSGCATLTGKLAKAP